MNELGEGVPDSWAGRALRELQRLADSLWVGVGLALIAAIFVFWRWRAIDFSNLLDVSLPAQVVAGVVYGLSLLVMAQAPRHGEAEPAPLLYAGLAAHLLKYVPGSVWQGQRLLAVGGLASVARFGLCVLIAAGIGLLASGRVVAIVGGVTVVAVGIFASARMWGLRESLRLTSLSLGVTLAVFVSGVLVGVGADLDPWWSGREVSGAWGLGVVAIPVPAGLGIRELFFSLSSMPEAAAELGVVHRVVTLVVDGVIGAVGILGFVRMRG